MNTQPSNFRIGAALSAAGLSFFLPVLADFVVSFGYGMVVGFQTRGDMDVINQRVTAMLASPFYVLFLFAVFAAVAFWRGRVAGRRAGGAVALYAVVIAVVAVALTAGAYVLLRGENPLSIKTLVEGLIILGFSYLGLSTGSAASTSVAAPSLTTR